MVTSFLSTKITGVAAIFFFPPLPNATVGAWASQLHLWEHQACYGCSVWAQPFAEIFSDGACNERSSHCSLHKRHWGCWAPHCTPVSRGGSSINAANITKWTKRHALCGGRGAQGRAGWVRVLLVPADLGNLFWQPETLADTVRLEQFGDLWAGCFHVALDLI